MKRKIIALENGAQIQATEAFTDGFYFLDSSEKFLLFKKKINNVLYLLLFEKGQNEKYCWRDGSKHDELRSTPVSQEEMKMILKSLNLYPYG